MWWMEEVNFHAIDVFAGRSRDYAGQRHWRKLSQNEERRWDF